MGRTFSTSLKWAAVTLALTLGFLPAGAQQQPRRVALVIANATYNAASVLTNPPNDARLVADALRRAGFQTIDMKSNLPVAGFRTALREFRTKAAGAQVALVYYAGHGVEANGKNWLIPTDAALNSELDLTDEAIDLDRVIADVAGADLRVVIVDACRNNPYGRTWRSGTRAVTRGLGAIDADDVLVIFAAAPGQTASDGVGLTNSPFATALAQRLSQTDLPVQVLGNVVRDDVLRATSGLQRPFVSASMTGELFYLMPRGGGVIDPELDRLRHESEALRVQRPSVETRPSALSRDDGSGISEQSLANVRAAFGNDNNRIVRPCSRSNRLQAFLVTPIGVELTCADGGTHAIRFAEYPELRPSCDPLTCCVTMKRSNPAPDALEFCGGRARIETFRQSWVELARTPR